MTSKPGILKIWLSEPVYSSIFLKEQEDEFWCCGGSDETPPEHTQDCSVNPPDCYLCKKVKATHQVVMDDAYASVCEDCDTKRKGI
jgi:hypothetical protein